jgi:hypothetical protein
MLPGTPKIFLQASGIQARATCTAPAAIPLFQYKQDKPFFVFFPFKLEEQALFKLNSYGAPKA